MGLLITKYLHTFSLTKRDDGVYHDIEKTFYEHKVTQHIRLVLKTAYHESSLQ